MARISALALVKNDVGYNHTSVGEESFGVISPTFEDVGTAEIDIQNIVPVSPDAGANIGDGSYEIQTIKTTGETDEIFSYKTTHEDSVAVNGWYNSDGTLATKKLTLGEGLWYYSYWPNSSMLFSGQVEMNAVDMPLCEDGFGVTGVARPADIDIQDILPISDEAGADIGDGSYEIQTIKSTGETDVIYAYKTTHEDSVPKNGWYTSDGELAVKTLKAGEGLWYYSYWGGSVFRLKALNATEE